MSQEPILYARSLKDNIAYGLSDQWDMEMVRDAAIKANAHVFIQEMKDQYDTEAGEKGAQLSGMFFGAVTASIPIETNIQLHC